MCEISNVSVNGFQSWYFPDKPYSKIFYETYKNKQGGIKKLVH